MPQIRDLLTHVSIEYAQRRRICHRQRSDHSIEKGQVCLVVADVNGGGKNYCAVCAPDILKKAQTKLAEFAVAVGLAPRGLATPR